MLDLHQLKRIAFRVETSGRVKDLRGFTKGHSVPDYDAAVADKFVARIAAEDLKADIDSTYAAIRESFDFKRKDVEASFADGAGVIHTPKFDYSISVRMDREDSIRVLWRREIGTLSDPSIVKSPEFQQSFGTLFDTLVFEFLSPVDVATLVDEIEDAEVEGIKVRCSSDASTCEIAIANFRGAICVDERSLRIEGRSTPTASLLLDQFQLFVERFAKGTVAKEFGEGSDEAKRI